MWWNGQGLDRSIDDGHGNNWHFRVWSGISEQRIYFWDERKETTGVAVFKNNQTLHIRRIKDRMIKIAKDKSYRDGFLCEPSFPLEKFY